LDLKPQQYNFTGSSHKSYPLPDGTRVSVTRIRARISRDMVSVSSRVRVTVSRVIFGVWLSVSISLQWLICFVALRVTSLALLYNSILNHWCSDWNILLIETC